MLLDNLCETQSGQTRLNRPGINQGYSLFGIMVL